MKLPILQKAKLLQYSQTQPLSKYDALCLSVIIPHGSTDIWMYPLKKYALLYGSSFSFIMFQPIKIKYIMLFLYSLIHIKNDLYINRLSLQFLYSGLLHLSWLWYPEWSLSYLAWIHTFIHYKKVLPLLSKLQCFSLLITSIFIYFLLVNQYIYEYNCNNIWIPIVIGHILTNIS